MRQESAKARVSEGCDASSAVTFPHFANRSSLGTRERFVFGGAVRRLYQSPSQQRRQVARAHAPRGESRDDAKHGCTLPTLGYAVRLSCGAQRAAGRRARASLRGAPPHAATRRPPRRARPEQRCCCCVLARRERRVAPPRRRCAPAACARSLARSAIPPPPRPLTQRPARRGRAAAPQNRAAGAAPEAARAAPPPPCTRAQPAVGDGRPRGGQ